MRGLCRLKNCYALGVGLAHGVLEAPDASVPPDRLHNYEAALFAQGAVEIAQMLALHGGRPETATGLATVGDMYVTSIGGRNVQVGRLLGAGARFEQASARLGHPTLEGAAAIREIGEALPKLASRGMVSPEDFPLLRHLYEVIALDLPLDIPWRSFFGGEPGPSEPRRTRLRN